MLSAKATEHPLSLTNKVFGIALTLSLKVKESIGARDVLERNLTQQSGGRQDPDMTPAAQANSSVAWILPASPELR